MPNNLPIEKQAAVINALCEGASIRSTERITGVNRQTVMRLGVRVGEACGKMMDEAMRNLPCEKIEVDEIWGYIQKKQRMVKDGDDPSFGDAWTFIAVDPDTKAVPSFLVGKRDYDSTQRFVADVAGRMRNRIQLSSDSMQHYIDAVEKGFGGEGDYGQIVKIYRSPAETGRYSPPEIESVKRSPIVGEPSRISTSIVERQNLTMRMHCRRLTRLTNAFSKKLENFKAAVALHFAYYNFVKIHSSIRVAPAMALGVSSRLWSVADLVDLAER
jgi:IS1 family transposase